MQKMQQKCEKNGKIIIWNFQCLQTQDFPKYTPNVSIYTIHGSYGY